MRLIIDIPEKEFGIDIDDKFKGFFSRLKVEIKEHLMNDASLVCGAYELETIDMFLDAFKNATPLPEHHGDLIDRDKLVPYCRFRDYCWANKCDNCSDYAVDYSNIKNAPTIIERR